MLTLSQTNCAAGPDFRLAVVLPFDVKDETTTQVFFDGATPCTLRGGAASLYRVYRLPDYTVPYMVSIASVPTAGRIFAPRVTLLNASGTVAREIPRDTTIFRNGNLSVLFRGRKGEDYLLIESDPERVAQTTERVEESTNTTMFASGSAYFTLHSGNDVTNDLVYSHDGSVSITLSPIPAGR